MSTSLEKKIYQKTCRAVMEYELIAPGDKILVAISGGKDSYTMLRLLDMLRRRAPVHFSLLPVHVNQGQPQFQIGRVREILEASGLPHEILDRPTYPIVKALTRPDQSSCFLCSRLRRGILYTAAPKLGCNKIALGHHRDDLLETLLMNIFRTGQLKTMPPKLAASRNNLTVIRPLCLVGENEIKAYTSGLGFVPAPCNFCETQDQGERKYVRALLEQVEKRHPAVRHSMLAALKNVRASHLLDRELLRGRRPEEDQLDSPPGNIFV